MKVLMLPGYRYPASMDEPVICGDLRYSFNLSRALKRAGASVTVLTRAAPGDALAQYFDGVAIYRYRPELGAVFSSSFDISLRRFLAFRRLHRKADAVISNTPFSLELFTRLATPMVYVCSGLEDVRNYGLSLREAAQYSGIRLLRDPARRLTWRRANRINTAAEREDVTLERWGVPRRRITRIGPGVEIERYRPGRGTREVEELRREWSAGQPSCRFVLSVSRFSPAKGLLETVRAFARLRAFRPDALLVLVGVRHSHRADYVDRVRRAIADLTLGDAVLIREDVPESRLPFHYSAADVTSVFSVGYDPLPTVMIESMSCGTPVVSTDFATRTQVITHGETGLLVPEADETAWAAAVGQLLGDPRMAERMTEAGIAKVRERFDMNRIALDYLELLRSR